MYRNLLHRTGSGAAAGITAPSCWRAWEGMIPLFFLQILNGPAQFRDEGDGGGGGGGGGGGWCSLHTHDKHRPKEQNRNENGPLGHFQHQDKIKVAARYNDAMNPAELDTALNY